MIRRSVGTLALLAVLATACTAAPATTATAAPSGPVAITDKTRAELEAVLAKRQQALASKDLTTFQSTVDLTRPSFRRCQQERFDISSRSGASTGPIKIAKVERYLDDYVRAYTGDDENGYARSYFRRDGAKWILTEPKDSELGGDKSKTVSGLDLSYYGIDEDVIDIYAKAGLATRDFVLAQGVAQTGKSFGLRIFPTRGAAGPTVGCTTGGFHLPNNPNDQFIRLFANVLSFKAGLAEASDSTVSIIRHEALHWLQDQVVPGITARLDFWLSEGWPDYVGGSRGEGEKRRVLCTTPTPTFKQLVDGVLETPETPPELPGQYYAFANTMIEYLYTTFGKQAYFDLMTAYKDGVDPRVNYPKVLKVTPEQFYSGWIAWAKKKYC